MYKALFFYIRKTIRTDGSQSDRKKIDAIVFEQLAEPLLAANGLPGRTSNNCTFHACRNTKMPLKDDTRLAVRSHRFPPFLHGPLSLPMTIFLLHAFTVGMPHSYV